MVAVRFVTPIEGVPVAARVSVLEEPAFTIQSWEAVVASAKDSEPAVRLPSSVVVALAVMLSVEKLRVTPLPKVGAVFQFVPVPHEPPERLVQVKVCPMADGVMLPIHVAAKNRGREFAMAD